MALACEPRIRATPGAARLAGQAITRIAAAAGVDSSGKWSAFEVVVFAPRQNLKTEMLIARILAGLFVFSEGPMRGIDLPLPGASRLGAARLSREIWVGVTSGAHN